MRFNDQNDRVIFAKREKTTLINVYTDHLLPNQMHRILKIRFSKSGTLVIVAIVSG